MRTSMRDTSCCIIAKSTQDSAKAFDCVEHNKLWEILKEIQSLGLQGNWGVLGAGGEGDDRMR